MELEINETIDSETETKIKETQATKHLLDVAFELWFIELLKPTFHSMTRTFAHHRLGEKYDTNLVFEALNLINRGKHKELNDQIRAFRKTLFEDLDIALSK